MYFCYFLKPVICKSEISFVNRQAPYNKNSSKKNLTHHSSISRLSWPGGVEVKGHIVSLHVFLYEYQLGFSIRVKFFG